LKYNSFEELINEYKQDKISPPDIKLGVSDYLIKLLAPLRLKCDKREILDLIKLAYL
jgi:hypothetical protein